MPKRKTTKRRAPSKPKRDGEIIDAEVVEVSADERPSAPPVVVEVVAPRTIPAPQTVPAFGLHAVVADVKEAVAAGEKIGRMLRRLLR